MPRTPLDILERQQDLLTPAGRRGLLVMQVSLDLGGGI